MSHTYCSSLFHCVFSTKERRKTIAPEIQSRLWAYIARQPGHHRKRDFQAEFIAFLKKHSIEYDPRYVWG